jgi:alpha-tubulin suppressor-like RCC1 family protein
MNTYIRNKLFFFIILFLTLSESCVFALIQHNSNTLINQSFTPQISSGFGHTLAMTNDGRVFSWGRNYTGELGNGLKEDCGIPAELSFFADMKIIFVYAKHNKSCVVTEDGKVFLWGDGQSIPEEVKGFDGKIKEVSLGHTHNLALTVDGRLYSWGSNNAGQLGIGTYDYSDIPVLVSALSEKRVITIAAGSGHSIAFTDDNKAYAWGTNHYINLGVDTDVEKQPTPLEIPSLNGIRVVKAVAERGFSFILTNEGKVYGWGCNAYGVMLGRNRVIPYEIDISTSRIIDISSADHIVVVDENGTVFGWGDDNVGQVTNLGNAAYGGIGITEIGFINEPIIKVSAGELCSTALSRDGNIIVWGSNHTGQHGDATIGNILKQPHRIPLPYNATSISAQGYGGAAAICDGKLFSWGCYDGNLGGYNAVYHWTPTEFNLSDGRIAKKISSLGVTDIIQATDGTLYYRGKWIADRRQSIAIPTPEVISELPDIEVEEFASGDRFVAVLSSDGEVYVGGTNAYNFQDDPNTEPGRFYHLTELSGKNIVSISAGIENILALSQNGDVYTWEGIGFWSKDVADWQTPAPTPFPPYKLEQFSNKAISQVIAGDGFNYAISENGEVYQWYRSIQSMFDNDKINEINLTQTIELIDISVKKVVAGNCSTKAMALDHDGNVYIIGDNLYSDINSYFEDKKIIDIAAGLGVYYVLCDDGNVYGWGNYNYGSLAYIPHYSYSQLDNQLMLEVPNYTNKYDSVSIENLQLSVGTTSQETVCITLTAINIDVSSNEVKLICAVYFEEELISIFFDTVELVAGTSQIKSKDFAKPPIGHQVKLMVWGADNSIIPLSPATTLSY